MNIEYQNGIPEKDEENIEMEPKKQNNTSQLISSFSTNCSNKFNENNISESLDSVNHQPPFFIKNTQKSLFPFSFDSGKDFISYAGDYLDDIFANLKVEEKNHKNFPKYNYMSFQNEINYKMREILIDWIVEIHLTFGLKNETLFQTIMIIDAYLSYKVITRAKLQLLGVASLLISCKSHEIYYPKIDRFIDITDNAYLKNELLDMENEILKLLSFNIIFPTSNDFYCILAKAFNFDDKQFYFGKYFLESSLVDYNLLKYPPSVIGISCVYIVMKFFGIDNYQILYQNNVLNEKNSEKIIKSATREICNFVKYLSKSNLKSIKEKYSSDIFLNVAKYCEES